MYVTAGNNYNVGDWTTTRHSHSSLSGKFTVGNRVKITGIGDRGYDIEDEDGHRMCEIGWQI